MKVFTFLVLSMVCAGVANAAPQSYYDYRHGERYLCTLDETVVPNPPTCTETCQQWYTLRKWISSQWQNVETCAFQTRCEAVTPRCIKKVECAKFQTTREWIESQWQDVVTCAGTQSAVVCN